MRIVAGLGLENGNGNGRSGGVKIGKALKPGCLETERKWVNFLYLGDHRRER